MPTIISLRNVPPLLTQVIEINPTSKKAHHIHQLDSLAFSILELYNIREEAVKEKGKTVLFSYAFSAPSKASSTPVTVTYQIYENYLIDDSNSNDFEVFHHMLIDAAIYLTAKSLEKKNSYNKLEASSAYIPFIFEMAETIIFKQFNNSFNNVVTAFYSEHQQNGLLSKLIVNQQSIQTLLSAKPQIPKQSSTNLAISDTASQRSLIKREDSNTSIQSLLNLLDDDENQTLEANQGTQNVIEEIGDNTLLATSSFIEETPILLQETLQEAMEIFKQSSQEAPMHKTSCWRNIGGRIWSKSTQIVSNINAACLTKAACQTAATILVFSTFPVSVLQFATGVLAIHTATSLLTANNIWPNNKNLDVVGSLEALRNYMQQAITVLQDKEVFEMEANDFSLSLRSALASSEITLQSTHNLTKQQAELWQVALNQTQQVYGQLISRIDTQNTVGINETLSLLIKQSTSIQGLLQDISWIDNLVQSTYTLLNESISQIDLFVQNTSLSQNATQGAINRLDYTLTQEMPAQQNSLENDISHMQTYLYITGASMILISTGTLVYYCCKARAAYKARNSNSSRNIRKIPPPDYGNKAKNLLHKAGNLPRSLSTSSTVFKDVDGGLFNFKTPSDYEMSELRVNNPLFVTPTSSTTSTPNVEDSQKKAPLFKTSLGKIAANTTDNHSIESTPSPSSDKVAIAWSDKALLTHHSS